MVDEFDIVIYTLQTKRQELWKLTQSNMNIDMMNIMDDIRLEQMDQLDKAIEVWKEFKHTDDIIKKYKDD
jgi:hypothetical protein